MQPVLIEQIVFFRGIAQLVEHRSPKPRVVSSSLTAPATQDEPLKMKTLKSVFFLFKTST